MKDQDFKNRIMNDIENGKVKIRSKYVFIAKKLGIGSALTFSVILAVLFFNLLLFYVKSTGNLKYLSFGQGGVLAFLESFPYLTVIVLIVVLLLMGYLIKTNHLFYKESFGKIALIAIAVVVVAGFVLALTNIPQEIDKRMSNHPVGKMFAGNMDKDFGITGLVFQIGEESIILETPMGMQKIYTDKDYGIEEGQFVIAIGKKNPEGFQVDDIRVLENGELPVVEHRIDNFFLPFSRENDPLLLNDEVKKCFDDCTQDKKNPKECFDQCSLVEEGY